jgi:hypothetical protein
LFERRDWQGGRIQGAGYHLRYEEADPRCEIVALGPVAVGPDLDKSAVVAGAGSEEGKEPIRAKGHADLMRQARTSGIFTQAIGADPRGGAAHGMARKDIAVALEAAGAHARKTGRSEGARIRVRDLRKPLDRVGRAVDQIGKVDPDQDGKALQVGAIPHGEARQI